MTETIGKPNAYIYNNWHANNIFNPSEADHELSINPADIRGSSAFKLMYSYFSAPEVGIHKKESFKRKMEINTLGMDLK